MWAPAGDGVPGMSEPAHGVYQPPPGAPRPAATPRPLERQRPRVLVLARCLQASKGGQRLPPKMLPLNQCTQRTGATTQSTRRSLPRLPRPMATMRMSPQDLTKVAKARGCLLMLGSSAAHSRCRARYM